MMTQIESKKPLYNIETIEFQGSIKRRPIVNYKFTALENDLINLIKFYPELCINQDKEIDYGRLYLNILKKT